MTLVKICGIRNLREAECALANAAWAIGEVFAPSRRRLEPCEAAEINQQLGSKVLKVGVFVNESAQQVKSIIENCHLDMVQLHGKESPDYCAGMPVPVIKAFRTTGPIAVSELERWPVLAWLFDSSHQHAYGGTGQSFNHDWIKELAGHPQLIVAGGLNPGNVAEVIKTLNPMAVDVSSGVELPQGGKDLHLIELFMDKVKEANHHV